MYEYTVRHPCNCELCVPHLHLGEHDGDFAAAEERRLEKEHAEKLAREGLTHFEPVTQPALN